MKSFSISGLVMEKAMIETKCGDSRVELIFSGIMDAQNPDGELAPYFDNLHQSIIHSGIKQVGLDFGRLDFLNSRSMKNIVRWVVKLPALAQEEKYKIRLTVYKNIEWQETSLKMLTILAPGLIEMEVR